MSQVSLDAAGDAIDFATLTSTASIAAALAAEQFSVVYQPIVDLATSEVVGAEALVRWKHPVFGALPPASFIPAAEMSGAIVLLGRFVMETAIEVAAGWPLTASDIRPFLAVNVSGRELLEPDYANHVIDSCARFGLAAGDLRLEVIESFLDTAAEEVEANLSTLRTGGALIVVDDFGAGFSDHLRIAIVGASIIKIDRSLTNTIRGAGDLVDTAELAAILADAAARSIDVIAEGVETIDQAGWYAAHGCTVAQGFYFSKAISADKISKMISGGGHRHV